MNKNARQKMGGVFILFSILSMILIYGCGGGGGIAGGATGGTTVTPVVTVLVEKKIEPSSETQTVNYGSDFIMTIPPNVLEETVTAKVSLIEEAATFGRGSFTSSSIYDITLGDRKAFEKEFFLEFALDREKIAAGAQALPAYYAETCEAWIPVDYAIDEERSRVIVPTRHLTRFTVFYALNTGYVVSNNFYVYYHNEDNTCILGDETAMTGKAMAEMAGPLLDQAMNAYASAGFRVPPREIVIPAHTWIHPKTHQEVFEPERRAPIRYTVYLDSLYSESWMSGVSGAIYLCGKYEDMAHFKYEIGHELFHKVQDQYLNIYRMTNSDIFGNNLWLMEACASYAPAKFAFRMPLRPFLIGVWLPPGSSTALGPFDWRRTINHIDSNHEYMMAHFIDYLSEKGIDTKDLIIHCMSSCLTSPDSLFKSYIDSRTDGWPLMYRDFLRKMLVDSSVNVYGWAGAVGSSANAVLKIEGVDTWKERRYCIVEVNVNERNTMRVHRTTPFLFSDSEVPQDRYRVRVRFDNPIPPGADYAAYILKNNQRLGTSESPDLKLVAGEREGWLVMNRGDYLFGTFFSKDFTERRIEYHRFGEYNPTIELDEKLKLPYSSDATYLLKARVSGISPETEPVFLWSTDLNDGYGVIDFQTSVPELLLSADSREGGLYPGEYRMTVTLKDQDGFRLAADTIEITFGETFEGDDTFEIIFPYHYDTFRTMTVKAKGKFSLRKSKALRKLSGGKVTIEDSTNYESFFTNNSSEEIEVAFYIDQNSVQATNPIIAYREDGSVDSCRMVKKVTPRFRLMNTTYTNNIEQGVWTGIRLPKPPSEDSRITLFTEIAGVVREDYNRGTGSTEVSVPFGTPPAWACLHISRDFFHVE